MQIVSVHTSSGNWKLLRPPGGTINPMLIVRPRSVDGTNLAGRFDVVRLLTFFHSGVAWRTDTFQDRNSSGSPRLQITSRHVEQNWCLILWRIDLPWLLQFVAPPLKVLGEKPSGGRVICR